MKPRASILLVDDDRLLSPFVTEFLTTKDFDVEYAAHGDEGLSKYQKKAYDLLILDVKMPFKDGFSLATKIRESDVQTPIIFCTSEGTSENRIKGLSVGADDYLVKPYSMEELYLRIKNLLKRSGKQVGVAADPEEMAIGNYLFYPQKRELVLNEDIRQLSTIESRLLMHFLQSPNGQIDNEQALRQVWEDPHKIRTRSLTVYVSKLRQYLNGDDSVSILNIHGSGYRLVVGS